MCSEEKFQVLSQEAQLYASRGPIPYTPTLPQRRAPREISCSSSSSSHSQQQQQQQRSCSSSSSSSFSSSSSSSFTPQSRQQQQQFTSNTNNSNNNNNTNIARVHFQSRIDQIRQETAAKQDQEIATYLQQQLQMFEFEIQQLRRDVADRDVKLLEQAGKIRDLEAQLNGNNNNNNSNSVNFVSSSSSTSVPSSSSSSSSSAVPNQDTADMIKFFLQKPL